MTPPIRTATPPRLLLSVVIVVVAAALYVVLWRMGEYWTPELTPPGVPAESRFAAYHRQFIGGRILDIYGYYYPSMLYAARSIHDGGRGLFWNPLQNCGQPFFAMIHAGLLYPTQLLSLPLGVDLGLRLIPFFNLVVAGFFTYLLCRELGAGTIASLCGAVAFELGNTMMETVGLVPAVSGSYVWLPAAMLFCERMLKAPSLSSVAGLALVLAIDLVAGFPQMTLYIYQLVVLRTAWECATRRAARRLRVVLSIALALVLAPLLAAVQLLPALAVVRDSVRHADLPLSQMSGQFGFWQWRDFRLALGVRASIHQPLTLLPVMFGGVALLAPGARRYAAFYLATGVVCILLGLGPLTPMFEWYTSLPTGGVFRYPMRFMWLAGFCVAPLMALGVEAMLATEPAVGRRARTFGAVIMIWMAAGFYALVPDGLRSVELGLVALAVTASGGAMVTPRLRTWIGAAVVAGLLVNLVAVPPNAWSYLVVSGRSLLFPYAPTFVRLRARMTAQDRVYLSFGWPFDSKFALTPKVATMFEVPAVTDYEPLGTRRYAEFYEKLRSGGSPQSVFGSYWSGDVTPGFNRHLLNLAAARYILAEAAKDRIPDVLHPSPPLLEDDGGVRLYENPQALPRARYVPRVEVVSDPATLLARLASADHDPHEEALVEAPLASGFTGTPGNRAPGTAAFLMNDPEHLVLRVHAPAAGFMVLADQYSPGWEATVNEKPTPIVRANYVFRLIEVPAGDSRVEFRYAPHTLRWGALVSSVTILGLGAALVLTRVRRS